MLLRRRIRYWINSQKAHNKPYISESWDISFRCVRNYRDELGNFLEAGNTYRPIIHEVDVSGFYKEFICYDTRGKLFTVTKGMVENALDVVYRASLQPNDYWAKVLRDIHDIESDELGALREELLGEIESVTDNRKSKVSSSEEDDYMEKLEVLHVPYDDFADDSLSYSFLKVED